MAYICPSCRGEHGDVKAAGDCCHAGYVECPLSELPADAPLGSGTGKYGFGTVFTGRWELVLNGSPMDEPVRVYPLPPLASKMVTDLADARHQQGVDEAQSVMRRALGL